MTTAESSDIVIVGGGPAGLLAGLLFARAGLSVTVLEKHKDFLRDFRGDTVHSSTMQLLHELGLLDRFAVLSSILGRTIGLGFRRDRIRSPAVSVSTLLDRSN